VLSVVVAVAEAQRVVAREQVLDPSHGPQRRVLVAGEVGEHVGFDRQLAGGEPHPTGDAGRLEAGAWTVEVVADQRDGERIAKTQGRARIERKAVDDRLGVEASRRGARL